MALFMTLRRPRSRGNGAFTWRFLTVFRLLWRKTPKNQKIRQPSVVIARFGDCFHIKVKAILGTGSFRPGEGEGAQSTNEEAMDFSNGLAVDPSHIISLFADVFAASEGSEEGAVIGAFVRELINSTPPEDILVCTAHQDHELLGCAIFSRMTFSQDTRNVFILSPMAVQTGLQKTGIGQALISYGLDRLRASGVDVALTYGDPAYYCKTGFAQIMEDTAQPPLKLSQPHGWLGQALNGHEMKPLKGPSRCVSALNNPSLW